MIIKHINSINVNTHMLLCEHAAKVPMLSSAVSEAIGAMSEVSETEKQTTRYSIISRVEYSIIV